MTVLADTRYLSRERTSGVHRSTGVAVFAERHSLPGMFASHIAGGTSRTDDGKRMSINVERIAGNMLIQHYVEDIAEPYHVRVNSLSDSFTDAVRLSSRSLGS